MLPSSYYFLASFLIFNLVVQIDRFYFSLDGYANKLHTDSNSPGLAGRLPVSRPPSRSPGRYYTYSPGFIKFSRFQKNFHNFKSFHSILCTATISLVLYLLFKIGLKMVNTNKYKIHWKSFFKAEHGAPWAESTISGHLGVENLQIFPGQPQPRWGWPGCRLSRFTDQSTWNLWHQYQYLAISYTIENRKLANQFSSINVYYKW